MVKNVQDKSSYILLTVLVYVSKPFAKHSGNNVWRVIVKIMQKLQIYHSLTEANEKSTNKMNHSRNQEMPYDKHAK